MPVLNFANHLARTNRLIAALGNMAVNFDPTNGGADLTPAMEHLLTLMNRRASHPAALVALNMGVFVHINPATVSTIENLAHLSNPLALFYVSDVDAITVNLRLIGAYCVGTDEQMAAAEPTAITAFGPIGSILGGSTGRQQHRRPHVPRTT